MKFDLSPCHPILLEFTVRINPITNHFPIHAWVQLGPSVFSSYVLSVHKLYRLSSNISQKKSLTFPQRVFCKFKKIIQHSSSPLSIVSFFAFISWDVPQVRHWYFIETKTTTKWSIFNMVCLSLRENHSNLRRFNKEK